MLDGKKEIKGFLNYYFQKRENQYLKNEISYHQLLIEKGVLYEIEGNKGILELVSDSDILQEIVLEVLETKLNTKLPLDISQSFKLIGKFEDCLKKEYNCENSVEPFDPLIKGLKKHVLSILVKQGVNVKEFFMSLPDEENRDIHLISFELTFLSFLFESKYSEKDMFEILFKLWNDQYYIHEVFRFLNELSYKNPKKSRELLAYGYENNEPLFLISELLIALYAVEEISLIDEIIELKKRDRVTCLKTLSRLKYKNEQDLKKAYSQVESLDFENIDIASGQISLIYNIIESNHKGEAILKEAFRLYAELLKNGTEEITSKVFKYINSIRGYEKDKYQLLYTYLLQSKDFKVIKKFFKHFKDPIYIFDVMMWLFSLTPDYRFSMNLFEDGIRYSWRNNQIKTQECILNCFREEPTFGILGVKILFTASSGVFSVDLTKLEKAEYQINVINSICNHPHSLNELLPLVLPLRNSKLKGVRSHLQQRLAEKVFDSYRELLYKQIESNIGNTKKEQEFLKPIKGALQDYNKLKEFKESLNDLNPYDNERELMDLYYRLEREAHAKIMNEAREGKGTFLEMLKTVTIVRGNSSMIREGEITPLAKIESSILVDGMSYRNPDLYESNLNDIG